MGVFHIFKIVQMVSNRATHHIWIMVTSISMSHDNNVLWKQMITLSTDSSLENGEILLMV